MNIDWTAFTPWAALGGGAVIGAATALYLLGAGRIAGISGLVGGPLRALVRGRTRELDRTSLLFVVGLLLAPWAWRAAGGAAPGGPAVGPLALVAAGLLVGVGVRMGNGCTSGHGVCGLSRLSPRSLVNVLAFMGAGFACVFVVRHLLNGAA
jgi:uncharacterized membrane protein YedE/YeeE